MVRYLVAAALGAGLAVAALHFNVMGGNAWFWGLGSALASMVWLFFVADMRLSAGAQLAVFTIAAVLTAAAAFNGWWAPFHVVGVVVAIAALAGFIASAMPENSSKSPAPSRG